MNNHGQASIEFVLVLLFMLVMVLSIVIPLGQSMQEALDDVRTVGSLSAGVSKIDHTTSLFLSIPGDNSQVLDLYLPPDTNWLCDPSSNEISVTFALNSPVYNTDGSVPSTCKDPNDPANPGLLLMTCTKVVAINSPHVLSCQQSASNFGLEVGSSGFTQRFILSTEYDSILKQYAVNFDATT